MDVQGLQRLWSLVTDHLTSRLQRANQHFLALAERTRSYVDETDQAVQGVDPHWDQALYAQFNRSTWPGPQQWSFEPHPTFYDTPDFVVEPNTQAYLSNSLIRARQVLRDVSPKADKAQADYQALAHQLEAGPIKDTALLQVRIFSPPYT